MGLAQSLSHTSYQVTFRRAAPEYTASEKKRPAREVRNSTDKQRSQLKHQKVESLPPPSSSSSFFTPSSLSSLSNPFGSYSSTSTASTTSAALSSDFSGASQRLVPPQPRVGDGYVQTSEARTQASLWLNAARPQARKAAAVELLRGLPAEDLQHVLKSFEHKRTSSSASTESDQVLDVAERIRSEAINYKESLLTLAEERQQRRRGEGLKESEIRGVLSFVDAYGDLDIRPIEKRRENSEMHMPTLTALMMAALPGHTRVTDMAKATRALQKGTAVTRRSYTSGVPNKKIKGEAEITEYLGELREPTRRCCDVFLGVFASSVAGECVDEATLLRSLDHRFSGGTEAYHDRGAKERLFYSRETMSKVEDLSALRYHATFEKRMILNVKEHNSNSSSGITTIPTTKTDT